MKGPPPLPRLRTSAAVARPLPIPNALSSAHSAPPRPQLEPRRIDLQTVTARESQPVTRFYEPTSPGLHPQTRGKAARKDALVRAMACTIGLLAAGALLFWLSPRFAPSPRISQPTSGTAELLPMPPTAVGALSAAHASGPFDGREVVSPSGAAPPHSGTEATEDSRVHGPERKPTEHAHGDRKRSKPGRADVLEALGAVAPEVAACIAPLGGVARVKVTFAGATGRTVRARLLGKADRGVALCVTHAISRAKLPAFSKRRLVVTHTFGR